MAIIFKCDVCDVINDDEIKVYKVGKQVKEECFNGINHICKQCLADANEDKALTIKEGKVVYKILIHEQGLKMREIKFRVL